MKELDPGLKAAIAPTALDRMIAWVDPVRGAKRRHARVALALSGGLGNGLRGGYVGARRDRRSMQEWRTSTGSADADSLPDLPMLRERSRDLERNAPLASGAINTNVTSVVGTGLLVQSRIDADYLGLDEGAAEAWQRGAERFFYAWADSQECDATRTSNLYGLQELAFRSALVSGDVFAVKRFFERDGSPFGLKVQLIEADRVSNPGYKSDSPTLAGGVELDRYGAPRAYHVLNRHPGDWGAGERKWERLPAYGADSAERNVLHLFRRLRPGQTRGVPYLAPVIETFKQLDRYTEAEIMAAVVSAMFTVFITSEGTAENSEGLGAVEPTTETGARSSDKDYKLGTGAIFELGIGEKIQTADPKRPNAAFDPFVVSILQQAGASLEVPMEVLVKYFRNSYSAARAALLEAWRWFLGRRVWLADGFCQPLYEALITECVAREFISAPGFMQDPMIRRAWLGAEWTGPSPGQIDPLSEVEAAKERIDLGISTHQRETARLEGTDWEDVNTQLAKERRKRVAAGLEPEELEPKRERKPDGGRREPLPEPVEPDVPESKRRARLGRDQEDRP